MTKSNLDVHHFRRGAITLSRRAGFTLVEIIVVVVLMSLMASTALLGVRVPLAKAARENSIDQVKAMDNMARQRASGGTPMLLSFELSEGLVQLNESPTSLPSHSISLASPCKLLALKIEGKSHQTKGSIRFDRFGVSSDYAIKIGNSDNDARWILFLGMTGQSYEFQSSDPRIEQLFEQARADAR